MQVDSAFSKTLGPLEVEKQIIINIGFMVFEMTTQTQQTKKEIEEARSATMFSSDKIIF